MTQRSREDTEQTLENSLRLLERQILLVRTACPAERAAYAADLVRLSKGIYSIATQLDDGARTEGKS